MNRNNPYGGEVYATLEHLTNDVMPRRYQQFVPNPLTGKPDLQTVKPWLEQPAGGISFDEESSLVIPAVGTGFQLVLAYKVPAGHDGVVKWIENYCTSGTFVDGSGDLIWMITANRKAIKNYESIGTEKGGPRFTREVSPIRIYSGQLLEYWVNHPQNPMLANAFIVCGFTGYYYPQI